MLKEKHQVIVAFSFFTQSFFIMGSYIQNQYNYYQYFQHQLTIGSPVSAFSLYCGSVNAWVIDSAARQHDGPPVYWHMNRAPAISHTQIIVSSVYVTVRPGCSAAHGWQDELFNLI